MWQFTRSATTGVAVLLTTNGPTICSCRRSGAEIRRILEMKTDCPGQREIGVRVGSSSNLVNTPDCVRRDLTFKPFSVNRLSLS